ncbi:MULTISPECIES: MazG-like family protein [Metasolibacillus]|uniref:MazG nucleotide pyrophosphohydrolase domain-containing protein n=1 Tax=Metasolibacillus TaxID=2703677 RepID=UPI00079598B8|nr:MazG-like family protein [Metasolibacillus fluoroglycofenilyticus]KYG91128.1 hypothetical protein A0U40_16320 [[Bacillus] sp. KCTC 13219]
MNIFEYQQWITAFYKERNWYQLSPFIRVNFLTEEVGEVSRAIRTIEIGRDRPDEAALTKTEQIDNLKEELGDVLDNLFILADKYDIDLTEIMISHKEKLMNRYKETV